MNSKIITHPSLVFANDLERICEPLQKIGIAYFSHVRINEQNLFSALGLQPEFVKLYLSKKYYNFDLHMAKLNLSEHYVLWDTIERTHESKELYSDFQDFGLGHSFSIVINRHGYKDCYHFSTQLGQTEMNQRYLNHLDLLKHFINYFTDKVKVHKELASAYNVTFKIDTTKGDYFTQNKLIINNNDFRENTITERIYLEPNLYITKREWECLYWLSQGKTLQQTANLLFVTERTIKAHINHIKEKFSCDNLFQLGILFEKVNQIKVMKS
jgi:DNA-binding CsgD family transcriptional regulator